MTLPGRPWSERYALSAKPAPASQRYMRDDLVTLPASVVAALLAARMGPYATGSVLDVAVKAAEEALAQAVPAPHLALHTVKARPSPWVTPTDERVAAPG